MALFFSENRLQFFRPLTSKYREQMIECLRGLYARLYSSLADYSRAYNREQVLEVFQEAVTRTPVLDEDEEDAFSAPARGEREQANWILNQLLDYGWLERQMDEATLQSTYAFTRYGRLFTQPLLEASGRFRTRHRNTRNTRNALQSFVDKGEASDLLDAFEHSERIISDFSDVIVELDDRKRQLVKAVEAQQVVQRASDEFFDFMEKRFMPDVAIRLSADSVEKYREEIGELVTKARRKRKEFKAAAEGELRRLAPELVEPGCSLYLTILDGIETRMHNASSVMLPALRHALNSFTRRADIIMRQLTYSGSGQKNRLRSICEGLKSLPEDAQDALLATAGEAMASLNVAIPDPDSLRLRAARGHRVVNTAVDENEVLDRDTRRELFIQTALDLAFTFNSRSQREYVMAALNRGHRIHAHNLPVRDARELLMSAHVIELGAAASGEFALRVTPTGERVRTDYFETTDEFLLELIENDDAD